MNLNNAHKIVKLEYLILLSILALAFYIAFIPHKSYPYPVHIDEWLHLADFQALLKAGSTTFVDPYTGQRSIGPGSNLEVGFHLFWGVFQQISGISWMSIFRYFPGIIFMTTILSVYVMGRRQGFGWEAAFFASLIPTTIGILGPGFLVPVAMGLLFIPLSFFVVFNFKTPRSYLVLFIFTAFLLSIHAPSAISLVLVLIPYILLNLKDDFKHSLGITLALVMPFLVVFPWIFDRLLPTAQSLFSPRPPTEYVQLPSIVQAYGYLPIALSILGTFLLAIRGGKKNYGLVLGLLALLIMLVTFFTFHYGVAIVYERGLMFMMLMMSIVAGAGLMGVRHLRLPAKLTTRLKRPLIMKTTGIILCVSLIGITLAINIPNRQDIPYYYMIDTEDYRAFVWIKENVADKYERAILDPWKATAFTAITGKYVYSKIHAYPESSDEEAYKFLDNGSRDTAFLRKNNISIVYSQKGVDNPDLVEQEMKNVYLLTEAKKVRE